MALDKKIVANAATFQLVDLLTMNILTYFTKIRFRRLTGRRFMMLKSDFLTLD